jgi:uncharacterized protein (UPF0216 family)
MQGGGKKVSRALRRFFALRDGGWPVASPGTIDRWISLELGRINAGLVVERKSLARLRAETQPACTTREGEPHPFDRAALDRLAAVVTAAEAEALRLPITLFATGDLEDHVYLSEEIAARALRALEKYGSAFPFRDGRMYLPHSLAVDLVHRGGGTLQLVFG